MKEPLLIIVSLDASFVERPKDPKDMIPWNDLIRLLKSYGKPFHHTLPQQSNTGAFLIDKTAFLQLLAEAHPIKSEIALFVYTLAPPENQLIGQVTAETLFDDTAYRLLGSKQDQ